MSVLILLLQAVTTAAAVVVAWRAIMVVNGMAHRQRGRQPLWAWVGFGFSYIAIALAAIGSLMVVLGDDVPMVYLWLGYVVWTAGSAGLILCDRRRRDNRLGDADRAAIAMIIEGKRRPANDPQQVIQFDTFAPLCGYRGPEIAGHQLCRFPGRGMVAACRAEGCPLMSARADLRMDAAAATKGRA